MRLASGGKPSKVDAASTRLLCAVCLPGWVASRALSTLTSGMATWLVGAPAHWSHMHMWDMQCEGTHVLRSALWLDRELHAAACGLPFH